ncbi:cystathionine gamma-synthase [Meridianimarinicoccus roseus]|uniref:Cystathionine gamma-synthase n=1 Tax=Meridianimarinicoccus roseus TaxID=2072018 RepID=A0A2V2LGE2_9RHOB|nr:PLP-dependent transferase [Meridianimarinicoccus roseus]PWR02991.1 cystathionine gamma-synthase [Meridianimarinicoccus roseus]
MTDTRKTLVRRTPWPGSVTGPIGTPLQPSVAYTAQDPDALDALYTGQTQGFSYAREGHPNASVLASKIDAMEGVEGGIVVGSGMAAVTAVMFGLLKSGDRVLGGTQLYGRSLRLMREELPRMGIETAFSDPTDGAAFAAAITPGTRIVLVEVVSNPTLRVADMHAIASAAKSAGALLVVDNTFTTPGAIRGIDVGADVVLHSVTKLLAGHSDVTLGYVHAADPAHRKAIYDTATTFGLTPSPFDCWLAERGLFTFDLRFERASANAAALADALAQAAPVSRVLYPGRADHPDHARAAALLDGRFGNMVTFEIAGGREAANRLVRAAADLPFAPTLGDVATTLSHPASSSHRALSVAERAAIGIGEGTFRVSVGIEPPEFLLAAFRDALGAV